MISFLLKDFILRAPKLKTVLRVCLYYLFFLSASPTFACGCNGPINKLQVDIDSSDVIFMGVITDINNEHRFHLLDAIGNGLKYINFDIYRSHKGLNKAQLKISVYDFMSNTSCEGLTYGKEIGDTILIFANEFKSEMLGSYLCARHPKLKNLSILEKAFIDTATWNNPRAKYENADSYLKEHFSDLEVEDVNVVMEINSNNQWLYLSLIINLILVIFLVRKITK